MSRIRTVKPDFFIDEDLYDMDTETGLPCRLAFMALWCYADRRGRFIWKPREIKTAVMPHDDFDTFSRVLDALVTRGFIVKYTSQNGHKQCDFGWVRTFEKHQVINNRESESLLPPPPENKSGSIEPIDLSEKQKRAPRVTNASSTRAPRGQSGKEGKGRERKEKEGSKARVPLASNPPALEEAKTYALEAFNLNGSFASNFISKNAANGWCDARGHPYTSWKSLMSIWVKNLSMVERDMYTPKPKVDNSDVHR